LSFSGLIAVRSSAIRAVKTTDGSGTRKAQLG
jgi:hypothetical protein